MKHAAIDSIGSYVGAEVRLSGWVLNKRSSGKIQFIILRDGTGTVQCVVDLSAVGSEIFNRVKCLT